jgi:transposase
MTSQRSVLRSSWCGGNARYRCLELPCPVGGFSENHLLAGPRAKLTTRAAWWAFSCIQRDTASVAAVARRLGVDWHTVWDAIAPLLSELAADPGRLTGVDTLGVDEHVWHHRPRPGKGPKELTGIVDLTRRNGRPKARLLDLVPGRSGRAYADWLTARGEPFTAGVGVATLDPFRGYGNAITDELEDATAVLDAFHVVKLGLTAMEETRRRVQQEQLGHRGRKNDPLYKIRNILRAGVERLTDRQIERLETGLDAGDPDYAVTVAWRCYQQLRLGLPRQEPQRGAGDRGQDRRHLPHLPDPRDRPPGPHPARLAEPVPGLLHHQPSQQRRHRSDL